VKYLPILGKSEKSGKNGSSLLLKNYEIRREGETDEMRYRQKPRTEAPKQEP